MPQPRADSAAGPPGGSRRALDPHPDRVQRIRQWHITRAAADVRPVALVAVHITDQGRLHSDAIGVEPEAARAIATELRLLADQLMALAASARPMLTRIK